jgi:putative inorganic carbon (hco3(-)) transporter
MPIAFLILIFARPFISSLAFPDTNFILSFLLLSTLLFFLITRPSCLGMGAPLHRPLLAFLMALLIAFVFSQNRLNSARELYKYLTGILLLLFLFSLTSRDKNRVIGCIIFSSLIISVLAAYQYFFGFRHLLEYISRKQISSPFLLDYLSRQRAFFPFVTPSVLGGYLAMMIPLSLSRKKGVLIAATLACALMLTKSISAFLSLFVGMLVYFYLEGRLGRKKIIFIAGLWVLSALVILMRTAGLNEHWQPLFSAVMRLNYWSDTLKIIWNFPWVGAGPGNFNLAYSRYAHNSYLQIWAEMGILGLTSLIWLIVATIKSALYRITLPEDKKQTICLIAAHAIFLTHNIVEFTFFLPEVAFIWWIIAGLMAQTSSFEAVTATSPQSKQKNI